MTSKPGKSTFKIHVLPNISRRKGNQIIKLGQLIEYNVGDFFSSKTMQKMRQGDYFQTTFRFSRKLYRSQSKQSAPLIHFGRPLLGRKIKTNCIAFQTVETEICSILSFYKRFWNQLPQKKHFSWYRFYELTKGHCPVPFTS